MGLRAAPWPWPASWSPQGHFVVAPSGRPNRWPRGPRVPGLCLQWLLCLLVAAWGLCGAVGPGSPGFSGTHRALPALPSLLSGGVWSLGFSEGYDPAAILYPPVLPLSIVVPGRHPHSSACLFFACIQIQGDESQTEQNDHSNMLLLHGRLIQKL